MLRLRHFVYLALMLVLAFCRARAADIYDCYNGSTEQGGNRITVNGIQSNQYVQQSYPGATVTVFLHNTVTLAPSIFKDGAGTLPLANPFVSSAHSVAFVCAPDGRYDFQYSGTGIPVPFTVSDIKFCFACQGGGGSVNPGTPYQVTRYDATGANIQNSSGSDNPANGPTEWVNGLSVEGNAGYRFFVNSTAGTTTNLLVCRDTSVTTMTQVTTCATSANGVFGLADNGAGTTGNVRTAMIGFHPCVFDGQTVIGDWVIPSALVAGQCSDAGATKPTAQQVLGHVTTLNTGASTLATVDLFTGDTIAPGGGGSPVTVIPCSIVGCDAFYQATNVIAGDNLTNDDGAGNKQSKSVGLTDSTKSGFWYDTAGPALPALLQANSFYFATGTGFGTTYGIEPFDSAPTATHCLDVVAGDAAGWLKLHDSGNPCGTGSGLTTQTNGVNNLSQSILNLVQGTNCTLTNTSGGNVTITCTGGQPTTQIANPTAPTLSTNGTPGSTSYTYLVIGCEDIGCTKHTQASSTTTIGTGNATLSNTNSINLTAYGDTIHGPRGYLVCRTAGGATQGIITSGLIVGKKFTDTGLAGDGTNCVSVYAANNTVLEESTAPLPGCNIPLDKITGPDAVPCSPNAQDDEFQQTFGAPGDVNNTFWTWGNQQGASAAWTGGTLALLTDTTAQAEYLLSSVALPTAPYTYRIYVDNLANAPNGNGQECFVGISDNQGTPKMWTVGITHTQTDTSQTTAGGDMWIVRNWTSNSAQSVVMYSAYHSGAAYVQIQNDGSGNLKASFSNTGDGIIYHQYNSQALTTPFPATTPVKLLIGGAPLAGSAVQCTFDFERRTQ